MENQKPQCHVETVLSFGTVLLVLKESTRYSPTGVDSDRLNTAGGNTKVFFIKSSAFYSSKFESEPKLSESELPESEFTKPKFNGALEWISHVVLV